MDRCDIPGMVSALPARAEPGQFKERPVRAWANGFETLHPPEVVEGRESKVEKGDTAKMCATTCTHLLRWRSNLAAPPKSCGKCSVRTADLHVRSDAQPAGAHQDVCQLDQQTEGACRILRES